MGLLGRFRPGVQNLTSSTYNRVINAADQSDFHVLNIVGNYNHAFGNHNLNVTAGSNIEYYTNVGVTGERRDLIDITKPEFNMATGDNSPPATTAVGPLPASSPASTTTTKTNT